MPEVWVFNEQKTRVLFWEDKEKSDLFQQEVMKKLFETTDITLEKAIEMRKSFLDTRKKMTITKKQLTLNKKTPEN